jgi:hypothetical protein
MKATLEIELPKSCVNCRMYYKKIQFLNTYYMCAALNKELGYNKKAETQRYSGCPLKIIDEGKDENIKV